MDYEEKEKTFNSCIQDADKCIPVQADDREFHVRMMAEKLCCAKGVPPPDFIHTSECDECGWVLSPYPFSKKLKSCAWCQSGYTHMMRDLTQDPPPIPELKAK